MRDRVPSILEKGRVTEGPYGSDSSYGFEGVFVIRTPDGVPFRIICGIDDEWEHVSVCPLKKQRTPTWEEMCWVKNLFWHNGQWVVQYHPAEDDYVNNHDFVLHLWRPVKDRLPKPDKKLV